jgi:hypothetical protein
MSNGANMNKATESSADIAAIIGTANDTPAYRRSVYSQIYREEMAKARTRHGGRLSGQQQAGVKGNTTKRFFALGF